MAHSKRTRGTPVADPCDDVREQVAIEDLSAAVRRTVEVLPVGSDWLPSLKRLSASLGAYVEGEARS